MKNEKKLVGIKHFNSKAGKECLVITVEIPCDTAANNKGYWGNMYQDIFVPEELFNEVNITCLGKSVILGYEVNWGKAYLSSIDFK